MTRSQAAAVLALAFAALAAAPATADDSSLSRWVGFFSIGTGVPGEIALAIDDWEAERHDAALASLTRGAERPDIDRHRDEIFLLRGLVLDDLDWRDEAAAAYAGVLAGTPPSPYYPLALLRLLEGRRALGQRDAVIEAYRRYFDSPWNANGTRERAVRHVLEAYGDLRPPGPELTSAERETLASPTRLGELASDGKEGPSERVAYLAGLELSAAGELRDGIGAFERIGLSSPYYRYALFSAAQALFATDDLAAARRKLRRLAILPARRGPEIALAERARLLEAQLLFAAGDGEGALRAAADAGGGTFAFAAQLLRGEICLQNGSPSLAVAYLRDLQTTNRDDELDTRFALGLGAAYRSLGDGSAASTVLRGATERLGASRSVLEGAGTDGQLESLRREVESEVAAALERDASRRRRIAQGIRRVVAFKGPLNLGKVMRVLFTSHANTILGEPVYDTKLIGEWDPAPVYQPKRADGLWRTYLSSPERPAIEAALRRWFALESGAGESAWLAADTAFGTLEGRYPPTKHELAVELAADALEAIEGSDSLDRFGSMVAQASEWRRRRIASGERPEPKSAARDDLEERTRALLDAAVNEGLRRVVHEEAESLRRLQYEVDVALSQALAGEGTERQPER